MIVLLSHLTDGDAGTGAKSKPFRIAIAQLPITGDVKVNSARVKLAMREAAEGKARLIQFLDGILTGYA